jgi:Ca2+:H+ antiporter
VARRLLWASLVLAPITIAGRFLFDAGDVVLFVLAAAALIPLAWLIGEATEHAAEHTGPGMGGFLNASFGNAPELIITIFAINEGLPDVVRGSIAGSVISNILLVLGLALLLGTNDAQLDRRSLMLQLGLVLTAVAAFMLVSIPGFDGNPDRDALTYLSIPVAIVLLGLYLFMTIDNLRRHGMTHVAAPGEHAWTLQRALLWLGLATLTTAFISEILVHSLKGFGEAAGLSEFFIATVIVAIVGNAAEHGGAVVIARRGKMPLATEIAVSSSAQVALFVAPAVALVSFLVTPALSLAFRPIELIGMGGAAIFVAFVLRDGRSKRWEGWVLVGVYAAFVVWVLITGDRSA